MADSPRFLRVILVLLLLSTPVLAQQPQPDERLHEAQRVLLLMGYQVKPDGLPGQRTTQALTEFQRSKGLPTSGRLDDRTLESLRKEQETRFSRPLGADPSLGTGRPAAAAGSRAGAEPKPSAAPVGKVESEALPLAPGTRTAASPLPPMAPMAPLPRSSSSTSSIAGPAGRAEPEPQGLAAWLWILPWLGVAVFAGLLWWGFRRPTRLRPEDAEDTRREPAIEPLGPEDKAAPVLRADRV